MVSIQTALPCLAKKNLAARGSSHQEEPPRGRNSLHPSAAHRTRGRRKKKNKEPPSQDRNREPGPAEFSSETHIRGAATANVPTLLMIAYDGSVG